MQSRRHSRYCKAALAVMAAGMATSFQMASATPAHSAAQPHTAAADPVVLVEDVHVAADSARRALPAPAVPAPAAPPAPLPARIPATTPARPAPQPAPAPAPTAAKVVTTAAAVPSTYGCGPALSYLSAHSAPGFQFVCPGYSLGHQAMTCIDVPGVCSGQKLIVINVPCAAAYMNEAHNSWVLSGLQSGSIDPYGYCH